MTTNFYVGCCSCCLLCFVPAATNTPLWFGQPTLFSLPVRLTTWRGKCTSTFPVLCVSVIVTTVPSHANFSAFSGGDVLKLLLAVVNDCLLVKCTLLLIPSTRPHFEICTVLSYLLVEHVWGRSELYLVYLPSCGSRKSQCFCPCFVFVDVSSLVFIPFPQSLQGMSKEWQLDSTWPSLNVYPSYAPYAFGLIFLQKRLQSIAQSAQVSFVPSLTFLIKFHLAYLTLNFWSIFANLEIIPDAYLFSASFPFFS